MTKSKKMLVKTAISSALLPDSLLQVASEAQFPITCFSDSYPCSKLEQYCAFQRKFHFNFNYCDALQRTLTMHQRRVSWI